MFRVQKSAREQASPPCALKIDLKLSCGIVRNAINSTSHVSVLLYMHIVAYVLQAVKSAILPNIKRGFCAFCRVIFSYYLILRCIERRHFLFVRRSLFIPEARFMAEFPYFFRISSTAYSRSPSFFASSSKNGRHSCMSSP